MGPQLSKVRARLAQWGRKSYFVPPSLVLEIEAGFVFAARLDGSGRRVQGIGARDLPSDALSPQLNHSNVSAPAALQQAVQMTVGAAGNGGGRLGLLVPDPVVRVALLSFETLPEDPREAETLARWRIKDLVPFQQGEARLAYQVLGRWSDSIELLVMAAKNAVLAEYEAAAEDVNGGAALTLPATAALLPLLPESSEAGQLLVHVCSGWMTTVVVLGSRLRSWRTRELAGVAVEHLAGEVAREAARVAAGARDHLSVQIGRVWLCARPPGPSDLVSEISQAVSCQVERLESGDELSPKLSASDGALLKHYGAPVAGLITNSAKEA